MELFAKVNDFKLSLVTISKQKVTSWMFEGVPNQLNTSQSMSVLEILIMSKLTQFWHYQNFKYAVIQDSNVQITTLYYASLNMKSLSYTILAIFTD